MTSKFYRFINFTLFIIVFSTVLTVSGQRPYRVTDTQVQTLINRIETRTYTYKQQVDRIFNNSRNNRSELKDELSSYISDFENSTSDLKSNFTSRRSTADDVQDVLNRAGNIDNFMRSNRNTSTAQTQWNLIRTDLTSLAGYYRVSWNWNTIPSNPTYSNNQNNSNNPTYPTNPNYPNNQNYPNNSNNPRGFDTRLTGTYSLNTSLSDNVQTAIDRAISSANSNTNQRDRIQRNLERRLISPETLAIEKRGQQVTLASSMSPQIAFNADGVSRSETNPNGKTVQIRATATDKDLTIDYEGDRMNDFYIGFEPTNNRQLRVTRRVYLENRNETVTVTSVYDKTDQVARWDNIKYQTPDPNSNTNYPTNNETYNDFIVANNTRIIATLDTPLSTKTFRDGDRFSMTVTTPSQYQGAVIEGRVNGQKSGVVSGRANLSLDFDTIRLRDGKTYRFAGIVDQVRDTSGNNISVNNEGAVKDSSQTKKTVTRAGIGAALGAIIGAVAGGGSGAAIGAGIGAGAGAGTVVLQGRDNLDLTSGTEFSVTSSAPTNR